MAKMQRKDYAADAIVDHSQETLKRVRHMNAPKSVQATGHDKSPDKYIPVTEENIAALEANDRYLEGNVEGYVKSVTTSGIDPDIVVDSVTLGWLKGGVELTKVLTKAELLASETIFFGTTD